MADTIETLKAIKQQYDATKKVLGKTFIQEVAAPFFAEFPEITAVIWTQYTPYFNDGDPCEFYVNDIDGVIYSCSNERALELGIDVDDDADEHEGNSYLDEDGEGVTRHIYNVRYSGLLSDAIGRYFTPFQEFDDILREVLHEGIVTLYRDGRVIVNDYDHD